MNSNIYAPSKRLDKRSYAMAAHDSSSYSQLAAAAGSQPPSALVTKNKVPPQVKSFNPHAHKKRRKLDAKGA